MKFEIKRSYIEPIVHLLFWVGLFIISKSTASADMVLEGFGSKSQTLSVKYLNHLAFVASAFIFYGNILIFYKLFFLKRKYILYATSLILWTVLIVSIELIILKNYLYPLNNFFDHIVTDFSTDLLVNNGIFVFFSFIYIFTDYFILLRSKLKDIENNKLTNELAFLKAQLNPHFLFNTINNIFSTAQLNNDHETAQQLADFTKVIRYSLYESNTETVSLEKELLFLKSYVKMSLLKFKPDDIDIKFNINGESSNKTIAPLILVPLIENAFKHGPVPYEPAFLYIDIEITSNTLEINVENSYKTKNKDETLKVGGIGLKNLKRRLDLLYPNKHDLEIKQKSGKFETKLKLELND